jgi:hypothetical protein
MLADGMGVGGSFHKHEFLNAKAFCDVGCANRAIAKAKNPFRKELSPRGRLGITAPAGPRFRRDGGALVPKRPLEFGHFVPLKARRLRAFFRRPFWKGSTLALGEVRPELLAMLLEKLRELLEDWAPAFCQRRTGERALTLALGLLCGLGRRTVTRALCFYHRQHQDWSADYKLFNRSHWDAHALFAPVVERAIGTYGPDHIAIGLDDTRLRRTGQKIKTAFWNRDPLSPPFQANLLWGQRFLQAALLTPLYRFDGRSGPRGLPVRFDEVPPVRKPARKATPEQRAASRRAQKAPNLSTAFVRMLGELRRCFDAQGFASRPVIAVGDGSFCNQTTFRHGVERTCLLTRARKDLRLCFGHTGAGTRYYGQKTFTPQDVYHDESVP